VSNFGRLFAIPTFMGRSFEKLYPCYHHSLAVRRLEKFCEDTLTRLEVIEANALNFRPNFKFPRLKVFFFWGGGTPAQFRYALASLGQSLARVKIWGGSTPKGPKCGLPRKVHLGGSMLTNVTFLFVDQSSPDFFLTRNAGGIAVKHVSFRFWISGVISEFCGIFSKTVGNFLTKFIHLRVCLPIYARVQILFN